MMWFLNDSWSICPTEESQVGSDTVQVESRAATPPIDSSDEDKWRESYVLLRRYSERIGRKLIGSARKKKKLKTTINDGTATNWDARGRIPFGAGATIPSILPADFEGIHGRWGRFWISETLLARIQQSLSEFVHAWSPLTTLVVCLELNLARVGRSCSRSYEGTRSGSIRIQDARIARPDQSLCVS